MHDRREFLALGLGSAALGLTNGCAARAGVGVHGGDTTRGGAAPTLPKIARADEGRRLWAMGILVTVKVTSADTGGAYSVFEDLVPPGSGPVPHTHTREDETMYVLEGSLTAWLGGVRHELAAGDFVHMPRGVEHYFKNLTDRPARMLLSYTPGGFEDWFFEVGTPAGSDDTRSVVAGTGAGPAIGPEDIQRAVSAAEPYGVTFVRP